MSHTSNNVTLVCYDITSDKLRRRIDKCMKNFGLRLQFSVFICRLDTDGVKCCREKLGEILKTYGSQSRAGDSLIIFEHFKPDSADCLLGTRIEDELPLYKVY